MSEKITLPEYPVFVDMWEELKKEKRPIVIYGMGNGADKLIDKLSELGVKISDIFASDGFVRGHSFRGYRVKSFSEIKESYPDFLILLSFASNKPDVVDMLEEIDKKYDMLVPDMPIADVGEYFTKDFYNKNYSEILRAYYAFSDDTSRELYAATVNYKLTGRMKYLKDYFSSLDGMYSLLPCASIRTSVDCGAYNGDTVREAKSFFPKLEKVFSVEPDAKNFKKLVKYSEAENDIELVLTNAAAFDRDGAGEFNLSGNRNSSISSTASFEHKSIGIDLIKVDSLTDEKIDYIKYDVEGAELEALVGSSRVIKNHRPSLLVSLYHRSRDLFSLTNYLYDTYPEYLFYLRRLRCLPAWEINLIMIPKER